MAGGIKGGGPKMVKGCGRVREGRWVTMAHYKDNKGRQDQEGRERGRQEKSKRTQDGTEH